VALAGFKPDEVELTVEQNVLTLEGRKSDKEERTFLHRGISSRNFKRQFTLADHVEVGGAVFENGLLIAICSGRSRKRRSRVASRSAARPRAPSPRSSPRRLIGQTSGPDRSTPCGYPPRGALSTRRNDGGSHAADDREI
jgi:hypothetical protein